ncbi:hypothetical protein [Roseovarius sp.]|uniref:hypothetical protein n=1 Tax=Roseovarius sp. TaxID=1486281 RepID=UPI00260A2194|nr:hypothetical protein [Roseovarius sp.]
MTRWLEAAQRASGTGNLPKKPKQPPMPEVNSVNSVNSDARKTIPPEALARDVFEERAAIREHDGGQERETAERAAWPEARHAAGITALDDWRREADDARNPDAWRNSPIEGGRI